MIVVPFKRSPGALAPARAHEGDAGWDATAATMIVKDNIIIYNTGLSFAIPKGCWMMAAPRSSVYKHGLVLANSIGVIDSGYRGEVQAAFFRFDTGKKPYEIGDRILQLVIMPCLTDEVEFREVEELPESWDGRGEGGFGSTGVK